MASNPPFSYSSFYPTLTEQWQTEATSIFQCLDEMSEGTITREKALHAMSLLSLNGEDYFHYSKKMVTIQAFLEAIKTDREKNSFDNTRRWTHIFHLIAGPGKDTITREALQSFFTQFGHTPDLKFCDDFIDEFDRANLKLTEISLDDWLMFCRIHRLPF